MRSRGLGQSLLLAALVSMVLVMSGGSGRPGSEVRAASPAREVIGGPSAPAAARSEVARLRTRTARTYRTPEGAHVVELHSESVNYRDGSRGWRPIDNSFVRSSEPGVAVENKANRYAAELPDDLGATPVRAGLGERWAEFRLLGATGEPSVDGATVRYDDAMPGVDVRYVATGDTLKEELLLDGPGATDSYRFAIRLGPGLRLLERGRELAFVRADGRPVFTAPAPFAYDAAGVPGPVHSRLSEPEPGRYELAVTLDRAWLDAPERSFPVTVDPTIDFSGGGGSSSSGATRDCYIRSATPNTPACTGFFGVGKPSSTSTYRALLKFDVESAVPARTEVLDATLSLQTDGPNTVDVDLHRVTRAWNASVTWNRYDGESSWTSAGGDYQATRTTWSDNVQGNGDARYKWQLTELVQEWVDRSVANEGFLLKTPESATGYVWLGGSESATHERPILTIVYEPRMGERRQWSFERQQLRDRSDIAVNVANGNLLVTERDLQIPGTGLDVAVTRHYNGLSSHLSESGRGWRLNYGGEVGLQKFSDPTRGESIALYGPSGFAALYQKKQGAAGYVTPSGLDATLTKESDNSFTLKFEKGEGKLLFDTRGWLTEQRDRNGNKITYTYDANGNLTKITDTRGRDVTFAYGGGYINSMADPSSRSWGYEVVGGNLLTYTDPAGEETDYSYDSSNRLTQITDPRGKATKFTYDAQRRVATIVRVDNPGAGTGPTWTFEYEVTGTSCPSGRKATKVTDPRGKITTHCWDHSLRVTKVFDAEGHSRSKRYTANSDVDLWTSGSGAETSATYDGSNRLASMTSPPDDGNQPATRSFSYSSGNNSFRPDSMTDAQNKTTSMGYTTKGNLRKLSETPTSAAYVEIEYNDGDTGETANDGTVRWSKDGNGNQTSYFYTADGELERVDFPDGTGAGSAALGDVEYTYDSLSRIQTVTDGKDQQQTYFYDLLDRRDKVEYRNSGGTLVQTIDYTWDENGNMTARSDGTGSATFVFDALNRLTEEHKPGRPTTLYSYDASSNLASVTAGGEQVSYTYFPDNTIEAVFEPDPTPGNGVDDRPKTEFRYNPDNSRTKTIYPNGVTEELTFDKAERPKTIKATKAGNSTALTDFVYRWTDEGSTQERDVLRRAVDQRLNRTTDYSYDALNRLTLASTTGSQTYSYGYQYDNASNRTKLLRQGSVTRSYAYDNNNRLCWQHNSNSSNACGSPPSGAATFDYDANGNLTDVSSGQATYNALNQTTSIDPPGTPPSFNLTYAGRGQSERTEKGSIDFTDTVLGTTIEVDGSTTRNFVRDEKSKFVVQRATTSGVVTRHYPLFDQLGSTVALTDSTGAVAARYVYEDPFGESPVISGTASTPLRFAGGYRDPESGFYKFGERYYMPDQGRWTQRDPLNQALSPREANRYVYAGNDPVNITDLAGQDFLDDALEVTLGTMAFIDAAIFASGATVLAPVCFGGVSAAPVVGQIFGYPACAALVGGGYVAAGFSVAEGLYQFGKVGE